MATQSVTSSAAPSFAWLLLCALLLCGSAITAHAQDANGVCRASLTGISANNGADWSQPKDLVSALGLNACAEVWVEQGVYFSTAIAGNFVIRANSRVYGGFVGNETSLAQRDPVAHVTVLSGDKDKNDTNIDGNNIDESYTDIKGTNSQIVVKFNAIPTPSGKITSTTVLDGFTITGGDSHNIGGFGGGVICNGVGTNNDCSPTLSNLVIAGNYAAYGGGMYLNGQNKGNSSPDISHVVFRGNYATQQGGALYLGGSGNGTNPGSGNSSPNLTDVAFYFNSVGGVSGGGYGGGIYCDAHQGGISSPFLTDVTFDHNDAFYQGGGMLNYGYGGESSPTLVNVTFSNNTAINGAAMYNLGTLDGAHSALPPGVSFPGMFNVTFFNNHATTSGGAIYDLAFQNGNASPLLVNVTLANNSAGQYGGAIYSDGGFGSGVGITDHLLDNVILWGNTAGTGGSNIFINDTNFASISLTIDDSVVQGGDSSIAYKTGSPSSAYASGTNNHSGNPMLGPLANNGGLTLTMLPDPMGDAVDDGTCNGAPPEDQRGVPRPSGAGCDIGAVEAQDDVIFKNGFQ